MDDLGQHEAVEALVLGRRRCRRYPSRPAATIASIFTRRAHAMRPTVAAP